MDIQIIREFISLADNEDISIVADQFFISPSLLSLHIQKLERELGRCLFDRTPRRMLLNENGQLFLFYAKNIIANFDSYLAIAKKETDQKDLISVAMLGPIAQAATENIIAGFCRDNRDIKLNILSRDYPGTAYSLLANGKCDFVFMYCADASRPDIIKVPLFEDRVTAVVSKNHRLAGQTRITCRDIGGESILMQNADVMIFRKVAAFLEASGIKPNISFAVNSEVLMNELLAYNVGIGLVSGESAGRLDRDKVSVLELEPQLSMEFSVSFRKTAAFTPAEARFWEYIQNRYLTG